MDNFSQFQLPEAESLLRRESAYIAYRQPDGCNAPVLAEEDINILQALVEGYCAMAQVDISLSAGHDRKKVGIRLQFLQESGLVDNPPGKKKLVGITEQGRRVLNELVK